VPVHTNSSLLDFFYFSTHLINPDLRSFSLHYGIESTLKKDYFTTASNQNKSIKLRIAKSVGVSTALETQTIKKIMTIINSHKALLGSLNCQISNKAAVESSK
jgi:spore germination protein GerM